MAVSLRVIKERQAKFSNVKTLSDFALLCGLDPKLVVKIVDQAKYQTYKIKKKSGGFRLIEDPIDNLKSLQDKLNDYLQAIYFELRTSACYGFCISHDNEEPRHVVSNAMRHMGQPFMLNVDFKDFFHQVTKNKVHDIFRKYTGITDQKLLNLLTNLCTYSGRLPMGAPTSPALSNFAMVELDHELDNISKAHGIKYTRYADDLTFSSDEEISTSFFAMVSEAIDYTGLVVNPNKVKFFDRDDIKVVTGILVMEDHLRLQPDYLIRLEKEIDMYRDAQIVDYKYTLQSNRSLKVFRQEIQGKLNFASLVCPEDNHVIRLRTLFLEDIDFEFVSKSWLDAPYMT